MTKEIGKNISVNYGSTKIGEQERNCLAFSKVKKELGWKLKYNLEKRIKIATDLFKTDEH